MKPTLTMTKTLLSDSEFETLASAPELPVQRRTWFSITGNENREVDNSQWYRYYLDPNEEHGMGTVFLEALLDLAGQPFQLTHFTVSTEVATENRKRIDILIDGIGTDKGKTVIIENKIYHTLENNLQDYWDHRPDGNGKLAILLTLKKEPIANCGNFRNILHREWIEAVMNRIASIDLSPEQQLYLDAFTGNIRNLTQNMYMNEYVSFFVKHTDIVNRAVACKAKTVSYISDMMNNAARELKMTMGRTDSPRLRDLIMSDIISEAYLSVIFDELLTPKQELRIVLGLTAKNLERVDDLDTAFADVATSRGFLLGHNHKPGNRWYNYLTRIYKLTESDWANLDAFIVLRIRTEFADISTAIGNHLKLKEPQPAKLNA